jgi:predicted dehydrogenase
MVTTQTKQWYETDTKKMVDVTSPDNILVNGKLARGAVASVHVAAVPWAGGGVRMVVYGREGTLVATGDVSSQRGKMLRVQGAQRSHELADLPIPERYTWVPPEFPRGDPFNVGQMYALFAEAIRGRADRAGTGSRRTLPELPTFDTAVGLHRFLDTIRQSSDTGRELEVRS